MPGPKGRPILISSPDRPGSLLRSIREVAAAKEKEHYQSEDWLKWLIAAHPEVLPVEEFGSEFAEPVSVAREMRANGGAIDILLVSRTGGLIVVETKLWENPEQRREVVGQVLDYVTHVRGRSRDELDATIRGAPKKDGVQYRSLQEAAEAFKKSAAKRGEDTSSVQAQFFNGVETSLRDGRILLLVVGDAIRGSLEDIGRMLSEPQRTTQAFQLGLVELGVYPTGPGPFPAVVVPRVVGRTGEVQIPVRIRIVCEHGSPVPRVVTERDGPPPTSEPSERRKWTSDEAKSAIKAALPPTAQEQFDGFCTQLQEICGMAPNGGRGDSASLIYVESKAQVTIMVMRADGTLKFQFQNMQNDGVPRSALEAFVAGAQRIGGGFEKLTESDLASFPTVQLSHLLLDTGRQETFFGLVEALVRAIASGSPRNESG